MAQDATGTPTALWGIPKFNTAVDPPSGKGTNAMMDFIDGIIIPDLIFNAKGDLIAATAADTAARLPVGTNGQVLTADSAEATGVKWATAAGTIGYGTALPGSPQNGDLFVLVDNATTPTFAWQLRYVSAKASNKWVCIGGSPMVAGPSGQSAAMTGSYANVGTATANIPVSGDYILTYSFRPEADAAVPASAQSIFLALNGAGLTANDGDACIGGTGIDGADPQYTAERTRPAALTSGSALQPQARGSSANSRVDAVTVVVMPRAIGG